MQLCQNFGISGGGVWTPQTPPLGTPLFCIIIVILSTILWKVDSKVTLERPLRPWVGAVLEFYSYFNLDGILCVGGQRHFPTVFTPRKDPLPVLREAGWVPGPFWAGSECLTSIGFRFPNRPTRNESLYQLLCPGLHVRVYNLTTYNRVSCLYFLSVHNRCWI